MRTSQRSSQRPEEYSPPSTLEGNSLASSSLAGPSGAIDSVQALLSWLNAGAPVPQQPGVPYELPKREHTKFLALKYVSWRQPYAREVQLREGCITTLDPASGELTNQWSFDDAISAHVEARADRSAVLWIVLPGCWLPRPRRRTTLECFVQDESDALRVAHSLGFSND